MKFSWKFRYPTILEISIVYSTYVFLYIFLMPGFVCPRQGMIPAWPGQLLGFQFDKPYSFDEILILVRCSGWIPTIGISLLLGGILGIPHYLLMQLFKW